MIPLRDQIKTHITPIVNYMLIAINIFVFFLQWSAGSNQEALVFQFALIPADFTAGVDVGAIRNIFTSMFMHAGLAHIAGNMLYLWIFGDNIEDSMGHGRYLLFYLIGGLVASLTHIFTNPDSQIPTVGASGAIAAVLGAYLVLYPQSRVQTLIPLGGFIKVTTVPRHHCAWFMVCSSAIQRCHVYGWTRCGWCSVLGSYWWFCCRCCSGKTFCPKTRPRFHAYFLIPIVPILTSAG